MIPNKIHYCWFGRNPLPKSARKCIASWRKYLPNYEIIEWNEDNFDVNMIPYTQQAYQANKYAFVSDYARFWILYRYGGLYFDTDVEVIRSMDEIIERGAFMGIEQGASLDGKPMVAPGLGLGVEAGHPFFKKMLDVYSTLSFLNNGLLNTTTIVDYTTRELYDHGMIPSNEIQKIDEIWVYPPDYFCPMDSTTGIISLTDKTVSIHYYNCSWRNHYTLRYQLHLLKNCLFRLLGKDVVKFIVR